MSRPWMKYAAAFVAAASTLHAVAADFSDNGRWGTISTEPYSASVNKNGTFSISVKDTIKLKCSFIQRWTEQQQFPLIKSLSASTSLKSAKNELDLHFKYSWNGGMVDEDITFGGRQIEVSYTFVPDATKETGYLTGMIELLDKSKTQVHYVGLDRAPDSGQLLDIDANSKIKNSFRMMSLRNAGQYSVDIIANSSGRLAIESFPHLQLCDTGNFPLWDKTSYKKGEPFKLSFIIFIAGSDAKNIPDSKVEFKEQ